ncbi:WD40-repeat-containing domain protein [Radiomyces spectabilis]|uniref:WD40-repeat-containing domain protein n=1 Tax=Radiomyces spectabilis TaxID=64574 RepID=UPI00221F39BD|nr:WD40-repeat-containing domain protein [Radiomyces spectabilis]KAI8375962.1 WD40-repeat-containing domain protein [Radiomyces spectabilis]
MSDDDDKSAPVIPEELSKETRKFRKKKQLSDDEIDKGPRRTREKVIPKNTSDDEIDGMDTDDLLDQADKLPSKIVSSSLRRRRRLQRAKPANRPSVTKKKPEIKKKVVVTDPQRARLLADQYPDSYWQFHADTEYDMIGAINEDNPLEVVNCHISDQAPIIGMTLSKDGMLLATFSNVGNVKIWDVGDQFALVRKLRDAEEANIDEFYCGQFASADGSVIATGGKLKDRHRWSAEDDDSHILPCPIKIFDLEKCTVIGKLHGHAEEILCIKSLTFMNENYYISTSQDGYIIKWQMEDDWTTLKTSTRMEDGITCMAFTVSFLPNTGNKYFLAACDGHLRLYDFEEAQLMQTFEDMYSSYCDCGKFIQWLDDEEEEVDIETMQVDEPGRAWFISRGAEMCDVEEGVSSIPNACKLHKLIYPTEQGQLFQLQEVKKYMDKDYHANSWLVKITSNGRYILAPTIYGQIFVFNMQTGKVSAVMKEHDDVEVRDVILHPYRPLLFSSGDDGCVKVYTYKYTSEENAVESLDVAMA